MLVLQQVHGRLANIFMHHGASSLHPPLLSVKGPLFSEADHVAQFMDRNGTIVVLPSDHRVKKLAVLVTMDISIYRRSDSVHPADSVCPLCVPQ